MPSVAAWTAAFRMARRGALRSKGRTVLITVMVGLPVLLSVLLATLVATNDVRMRDEVPALMGRGDAVVVHSGGEFVQDPEARDLPYLVSPAIDELRQQEQVAQLQEATGAEIVPISSGDGTISVPGGGVHAELFELDTALPVLDGMVSVQEGRLPAEPNEVVVSRGLVGEGIDLGSVVQVVDGVTFDVVGVADYGTVAPSLSDRTVVGLPGDLIDGRAAMRYVVDGPGEVSWSDVRALNALGYVAASRAVIADPPDVGSTAADGSSAEERAVLVIVVTAIVIEVVLLAGPAFAVGVRRQRRELALVAATGGSPRDVRRVVLAQALVLGAGAATVGAVLGVGLAWGVASVAPRWIDVRFGPFDVLWTATAAALLLGTVAALVAALVPAVQAGRQPVAAVLAGRAGTVRSRRGWPVLGLVLLAGGVALCLVPGRRAGGEFAVAGGSIVMVLGAIAMTPAIVGLVGRAGPWLPLSVRLAARDTARHRGRSAPAIAAVMAAVAGVTTLAIANASDEAENRASYVADYAPGTSVVRASAASAQAAFSAVRTSVPDAQLTPIASASGRDAGMSVHPAACEGACTSWGPDDVQPVYDGRISVSPPLGGTVIADAVTLAAWDVDLDPAAERTLAAGGLLVTSADQITQGRADVRIRLRGQPATRVSLPAAVADLSTADGRDGSRIYLAYAVVPPATAARFGIDPVPTTAIVTTPRGALDQQEQEVVDRALMLLPDFPGAWTERGYESDAAWILVLLAGLGGVAVLIGTLSATGLALSDSRPDLATLAAVGAAPRTRRAMAAAQTAVLGLLGAALGIAVGFTPGVAAAWTLTSMSTGRSYLDVPWLLLAVLAFAVPLVAALGTGLVVRSRLPVVRRLAQ